MKVLSDSFQVDPDPTDRRLQEEVKRQIECKFERQCREIKEIEIKRSPVRLNPLAEALKGIGI